MYLNLGNELHIASLNSATKYPSIPTYHKLGERGKLTEERNVEFENLEQIFLTEKVDGTNTRVVHFANPSHDPALPASYYVADFLVGSREEFLHARGDRIFNKQLGIVSTMYRCAQGLLNTYKAYAAYGEVLVFYGEVYGGKTTSSKSYGDDQNFRLFDVARVPESIIETMDPEHIANWRESGGQTFLPYEDLPKLSYELGVKMTPLVNIRSSIPSDVEGTYAWLQEFFSEDRTYCPTDGSKLGLGRPEGLVVRNADRTKIAKIRFEDYERTLSIKR